MNKTKPYAHLQAINTTNRVDENELLKYISDMQKQLQTLAQAVIELTKEVEANRKFIETQSELSKKTTDVLKNINDAVYQTGK